MVGRHTTKVRHDAMSGNNASTDRRHLPSGGKAGSSGRAGSDRGSKKVLAERMQVSLSRASSGEREPAMTWSRAH